MRHTAEQIATKLTEAEALAAAGKTQSEIAKTLGISVMTFHRWRHARAELAVTAGKLAGRQSLSSDDDLLAVGRIVELQLENARLRKLVTDLLLEKVSLEEGSASHSVRADSRTFAAVKMRG